MQKEPGMKKIDTHVPMNVWNRYERWVEGRGNIPSRQLHTRLFELFFAMPEHLRLEVLYGKLEAIEQILAPLNRQRHAIPEDALRWCGMPLAPAWTAAEREHAVRVITQELVRRGASTDQLHAAIDLPAQSGPASSPNPTGLSPEGLALSWPEETQRCAMAVIGRSSSDEERASLHRVIDEAAADVQQTDTAPG